MKIEVGATLHEHEITVVSSHKFTGVFLTVWSIVGRREISETTAKMSPDQAREVARELISHADKVEKNL